MKKKNFDPILITWDAYWRAKLNSLVHRLQDRWNRYFNWPVE